MLILFSCLFLLPQAEETAVSVQEACADPPWPCGFLSGGVGQFQRRSSTQSLSLFHVQERETPASDHVRVGAEDQPAPAPSPNVQPGNPLRLVRLPPSQTGSLHRDLTLPGDQLRPRPSGISGAIHGGAERLRLAAGSSGI